MGPIRRGLILALLPAPAWASVCDDVRPNWDGNPVSAWSEAIHLLGSPVSLVLILAAVLVVRYRSQWGALAVCVACSLFVSALTFFDPTGGLRTAAADEGCVGSPVVFIAGVGALCVAMILFIGTPSKNEKTED